MLKRLSIFYCLVLVVFLSFNLLCLDRNTKSFVIYRVNNISFKLIAANESGVVIFPMGIKDDGIGKIEHDFFMAETVVTYELWHAVLKWALSNNYKFKTIGAEGSLGEPGAEPTVNKSHPVTMVSWRDAVIWCNALSEMIGFEPAYLHKNTHRVLKDATLEIEKIVVSDEEIIKRSGFRLQTTLEWEYAARYRGDDSTNTVKGFTNPYFTKGNSASGATDSVFNIEATSEVAWYGENSDGRTHPVGLKKVNALGLYDMSGNVSVWVNSMDWHKYEAKAIDITESYGFEARVRGVGWRGDWMNRNEYTMIGASLSSNPRVLGGRSIGFRLAMSK